MIRVTIWNEFRHERKEPVRSIYPEGLHRAIAAGIAAPDQEIRCVALDDPDQGLPDELLNNTDVLIWWGHCAHKAVADELVTRVQQRVLSGMGLIALHSAHYSKIFQRMMGTSCSLRWRQIGERERIWTVAPNHPVAQGLPESFALPHEEMYGERFDVPDDGKIVFLSWFEGGDVFRSGLAYERGLGRIFYFSPGHETFPTYYDANVLRVIANAVRWAAPRGAFVVPECVKTPPAEAMREAPETPKP